MANRVYYLDRDGSRPQLKTANKRQKIKKFSSIISARLNLDKIHDGEVIVTDDNDLNLANAWIGTQAQYDAAPDLPQDTVCFIIDSGEHDYSTGETETHKTWIDGKPIYRKVLTGLAWSSERWLETSSSKFDELNMETAISAQFLTADACNVCVQLNKDDYGRYLLKSDDSDTNNGMCIIEYTKQGD